MPSPSGVPLGHGPVVDPHDPSYNEYKSSSPVVHKPRAYMPSPSGVPLGHGPVIVSTSSASPASTPAPTDVAREQEQGEHRSSEDEDEIEDEDEHDREHIRRWEQEGQDDAQV